jgi:hypothetical protein
MLLGSTNFFVSPAMNEADLQPQTQGERLWARMGGTTAACLSRAESSPEPSAADSPSSSLEYASDESLFSQPATPQETDLAISNPDLLEPELSGAIYGISTPLLKRLQKAIDRSKARPVLRPRRAPKGSFSSIAVRWAATDNVDFSSIPPDPVITSAFASFLRFNYPWLAASDVFPNVLSITYLDRIGFRFRFVHPPPKEGEAVCKAFVASDLHLSSCALRAERFKFKSCLMFSGVSAVNHDGSKRLSTHFERQIRLASRWNEVEILGPIRLFKLRFSRPGHCLVYVDIADDERSSLAKELTRSSILLGDSFAIPILVDSVSKCTPRCSRCQRWGHLDIACRSLSPCCVMCSENHDEHAHNRLFQPPGLRCFNCLLPHRADFNGCSFYSHRKDGGWIRDNQPTFRSYERPPA